MITIRPKKLTDDNFKPYGWVLKKPDKEVDIESPQLRYWHNTVDLSNLGDLGMMGFMQVKRIPIILENLDVLFNSIEMYISLDGKPSIIFVAPSKADNPKEPDLPALEAFYMEGGESVIVDQGIWHWTPFPLTEDADFALGLKNNVILQDGNEFSVDDNEILYFALPEPVGVEI